MILSYRVNRNLCRSVWDFCIVVELAVLICLQCGNIVVYIYLIKGKIVNLSLQNKSVYSRIEIALNILDGYCIRHCILFPAVIIAVREFKERGYRTVLTCYICSCFVQIVAFNSRSAEY